MKSFKALIFATIGLLSGISAKAEMFTTENGLSSSMINHVYQDCNGIVWISTESGLNRYDGAKLLSYLHDASNPYSMPTNYVTYTYGNDSVLYVGSLQGLSMLDIRSNKFTKIPLIECDDKRADANINSIIKRSTGEIYVSTSGHGIFMLHEGDSVASQIKIISSSYITDMCEDSRNRLWISTSDQGVFCIETNGLGYNYKIKNDKERTQISSICEASDGNIYVSTMNDGLYICNKVESKLEKLPLPELENVPIKTLHRLGDIILIGSDGMGLKYYDIATKTVKDYEISSVDFNISKSKIHSIVIDNQGNMWLGMFQKGVMVIPSRQNQFGYIGPNSVMKDNIGNNCIMAVFKSSSDDLWVGTDFDGIFQLDKDYNLKHHYEYDRLRRGVPATTMAFAEDEKHQIWVGSFLSGLSIINPVTRECREISTIYNATVPQSALNSIVKGRNGEMWLGYLGGGLVKIDTRRERVERFAAPSGAIYRPDLNVLPSAWINSLLLTSDNKLYIGTYGGWACLDIDKNSFLSAFGTENSMFANDVVYCQCEDKEHKIWLGTENGIIHYNPQTKDFTRYTTDDNLTSNSICAIEIDENNDLWISTPNGLNHFSVKDTTITNYKAIDGIQGNEFSKMTSFKDNNGTLFFGGTNGITYFTPHNISKNASMPTIKVTDIYEFGKRIVSDTKSGSYTIIGQPEPGYDYKYDFSDNTSLIAIELATKEYFNNQRLSYMYKINDNDWVELANGQNLIILNDPAPDTYIINVKAKNEVQESAVQTILLTVHAAWYATTAAKVCYVILALIIIAAFVLQMQSKYRTKQKLNEHINREKINEAKINFFTDISHDIRTPMTLIVSPLQKLIRTDKDPVRSECYSTISKNAQRILSLVNQLLDVRKIEKGQLVLRFHETLIADVIKGIFDAFVMQAQSKGIDYKFVNNTTDLKAYVDNEQFDKIISNVLSNAFKFTPEKGSITVTLSANADKYTIDVADTGIGLKAGEEELIFNRFYQIEPGQQAIAGTGIGLHLTRSLVQLHHGTITAENNPGGVGCHFTIVLPLGRKHLTDDEISNDVLPTRLAEDDISEPVSSAPTGAESEKAQQYRRYRMALVEDDIAIREYIAKELSKDYNIDTYNNGREALSGIITKKYDVVVSDIMMPELDGLALCKKVKQNVNTNHIPVILLTAKSSEDDMIVGLDNGADAYIVKPFSIEILSRNIRNLIRNREQLKANYSGQQTQDSKVKKITEMSPDEKLMTKVMDVINENLSNPNLNVEMLADKVGISRVHLHRKLKEITSQTTRDFIKSIRLQQAAKLLSEKHYDINRVAELVGFDNNNYFSTVFKEMYGMTPSKYLTEHNNKNKDKDDTIKDKD
ncbi:MAG: response regulator [Bacteroidales bacterium]|nr:response regulator [Bacteroidales bacterium]